MSRTERECKSCGYVFDTYFMATMDYCKRCVPSVIELAKAIKLFPDIETLHTENERYETALERLARLGNEPELGNSIGNVIVQEALKGGE